MPTDNPMPADIRKLCNDRGSRLTLPRLGRLLAWLTLSAVALSACGTPDSGWPQASQTNTVAAYQDFLAKHPGDVHAAEARSRIEKLRDEKEWAAAQVASTAAGYGAYIAAEPNGAHLQEAREAAALRGREEAWQAAQTAATAGAIQDFLRKYPDGPDADQAREKLQTLAGYRAQLATARTQAAADREKTTLAARFSKEFPQIDVVPPAGEAHEYLIASAPMSEADSQGACASVKRAGHSCSVIRAPPAAP
jgi:outer membrane protein assembly factor BamD (BamD/ComL family)